MVSLYILQVEAQDAGATQQKKLGPLFPMFMSWISGSHLPQKESFLKHSFYKAKAPDSLAETKSYAESHETKTYSVIQTSPEFPILFPQLLFKAICLWPQARPNFNFLNVQQVKDSS